MDPLDRFLAQIKKEQHAPKLAFAYMFGSRTAGTARPISDTDVCLYYDIPNRKTLQRLLITLKGLAPEGIDVSLFQLLPVYVRTEVFKGKPLLIRNTRLAYDTAFETFREFARFRPYHRFAVLNTPAHPKRFMI